MWVCGSRCALCVVCGWVGLKQKIVISPKRNKRPNLLCPHQTIFSLSPTPHPAHARMPPQSAFLSHSAEERACFSDVGKHYSLCLRMSLSHHTNAHTGFLTTIYHLVHTLTVSLYTLFSPSTPPPPFSPLLSRSLSSLTILRVHMDAKACSIKRRSSQEDTAARVGEHAPWSLETVMRAPKPFWEDWF